MKINFTREHLIRLSELASIALFDAWVFTSKLGQKLNVYELIHTTSITQLNEIKNLLAKRIEKLEEGDEWVNPDNEKLTLLKEQKEFVNLCIGFKRHNLEIAENQRQKKELTKKLEELKESTKTPEERIKEMEAQLKELEEF